MRANDRFQDGGNCGNGQAGRLAAAGRTADAAGQRLRNRGRAAAHSCGPVPRPSQHRRRRDRWCCRQDEAPHDALSEWWYYTGHLETESGKRYGFELVFFQAVRGRNPVGYAAHFAVTDHQRRELLDTTSGRARAWRLQGSGEYRLRARGLAHGRRRGRAPHPGRGKGYSIDLKLRSVKPPALHGGTGWISFGPVGSSYYYSRTRMEVEGTSAGGGDRIEKVTGLSWMDHQWGNFILVNGGGWDWFSLQLDDGSDLMVTVLRDQPGSVAATYGTLVDARG